MTTRTRTIRCVECHHLLDLDEIEWLDAETIEPTTMGEHSDPWCADELACQLRLEIMSDPQQTDYIACGRCFEIRPAPWLDDEGKCRRDNRYSVKLCNEI